MINTFKKTIASLILGAVFTCILSCGDHPVTTDAPRAGKDSGQSATPKDSSSVISKPDLRKLHLSFANPKDPSCGMPLTAGLEDTVRYKGKLYGFCSKECKEAFLKDPETSLSSLK